MKKLLTALLLAVLALPFAHAATLRVNSQLPANATAKLYNSFSAAYTAAVAGDTLMIEGSPLLYTGDAVSVSKRLVILGTGYHLKDNPQTQANHQESIFDFGVSFVAGSAGSVIQGIWFGGERAATTITVRTSNIIVNRCYLERDLILESENGVLMTGIIITQNYLEGGLGARTATTKFSDVRVENNIIIGGINIYPTSNPSARTFSNFDHNTLSSSTSSYIAATTCRNNILATYLQQLDVPVANITHNLMYNSGGIVAAVGSINGNRTYSSEQLFAGPFYSDQRDKSFILSNNGFTAMADNGKEPGAFGGKNPYVLSGLPPIPAIYFLETPGMGTQQDGLPVTIRVKSN